MTNFRKIDEDHRLPEDAKSVNEDAEFQKFYSLFQSMYRRQNQSWFSKHVYEFTLVMPGTRPHKRGEQIPHLRLGKPVNLIASRLKNAAIPYDEIEDKLPGGFCVHDDESDRYYLLPDYQMRGYSNGYMWLLMPYETVNYRSHNEWAKAGFPIKKPALLTSLGQRYFTLENRKEGKI